MDRRTTLPEDSYEDALKALALDETFQEDGKDFFCELVKVFKSYYRGLPVEFKTRLDLKGLTAFQKAVYQAARKIPRGETRSYGWIAQKIGNPAGSRAVGQALGRNPLPVLVPCHRVLAADGTLGGFSGGLALKRHLLHLEKSKIKTKK
jgi:methylated-DNA-[protein]-cysteine S-methyltransferase